MNKKDVSKKAYARLRQRADTILKETAGKRADTTDQDLLETLHELEVHQVELDLQNETLRRTAKNLEAARDEYFAFYEFAPVGFVTLDKTGRVEKANAAAADLLQRPGRFLVGQTFSSRVYPEDLPAYFAEMKKSSESAVKGAKESLELRLFGKDDRIRHFHLDIGAEFDKQGRFRSWQLATVDITELKKAQKTAQESEKRFRALVEASSDGVYRMSPDWREMRYLLGKDFIPDMEEPSPTWLQRYIHPDDQEHVMAVINKAIRTKSVFELEHRVLRVDGSLGWTLSRAIPILDVYGEIIEWFGMTKDITASKELEQVIRRNNQLLAGIKSVFEAVVKSVSDENFGKICLSAAEAVTGSKISFLGEIGPDNLFHDIAISNPGWEACAMYDRQGRRRLPGNFHIHGIYGPVLLDGKPLIANNPASHPDRVGLPEGHPPLYAFMGVPLKQSEKTIGMIAVANREGGYGAEEREALETLAGAINESLARRKAERKLQKHQNALEFRVQERTAELQRLNEELKNEIERRKKFEADLKLQNKKIFKEQERRKYLSKKLVEILERERQQIAESLHNDVGQILTKLNMDLDDVIDSGKEAPIKEDALVKIQHSIMKSMDYVSQLAGNLRPHILENLGLVPAIRNMLDKWKVNSSVSFHFHTEEGFLWIDDEKALAIYRIVQEAVTNGIKHADAKNIIVNLTRKDKFLSIAIEDDGTGFEYDKISPSLGKKEKLGLIIMHERAIQIGGEFNIEPQVGKGTRVILKIPVE